MRGVCVTTPVCVIAAITHPQDASIPQILNRCATSLLAMALKMDWLQCITAEVYIKIVIKILCNVWNYCFSLHLVNIIYFDVLIFPDKLHKFILEQQQKNKVPLCLNPNSMSFKNFARYGVKIQINVLW